MHEWIRRRPGTVADRRALLGHYVSEIVSALAKSGGREAALTELGAVRIKGFRPRLYTWVYSDMVVRFAVQPGYRSRWMERHFPPWLSFLFPPTVCHVTVLRLLP